MGLRVNVIETRLAYSSSYTFLGFLPRAVSPDRGMGSSQLNFDHEEVCMGGEVICIYTCIHATSTHRDGEWHTILISGARYYVMRVCAIRLRDHNY
jgi:hypothetical protein